MPEVPPISLPATRRSVRAFAPLCPLLMNVSAEVFLETTCYVSGTCHVISPGKEGGRERDGEARWRQRKEGRTAGFPQPHRFVAPSALLSVPLPRFSF